MDKGEFINRFVAGNTSSFGERMYSGSIVATGLTRSHTARTLQQEEQKKRFNQDVGAGVALLVLAGVIFLMSK